MALMTKTRLTKAVHNCPETLAKMAERLPASFGPAVERYDAEAVNDILEAAVCNLLGTKNLSQGLEAYCRKVGIKENLTKMDDIDRILLINQYREDIDRQLRSAGV